MSDPVPVIAFPDDRRIGSNIEFNLGDAWNSSCAIVAVDPIKGAIAIRNQDSCSRNLRMPFAQIPLVAYDKLDVLGDEIEPVSQLNQLRTGRATKTRINFNDDRATLRPPEFYAGWPPTKAESAQTAQRDIDYPLLLFISQ